jgi:hypothetical protein
MVPLLISHLNFTVWFQREQLYKLTEELHVLLVSHFIDQDVTRVT